MCRTGANGAQLTQDPRNLLGLTSKSESLNTKTGMGYNRTGGEEGAPWPHPEWAEDRRPGQNQDILGMLVGLPFPRFGILKGSALEFNRFQRK